MTQTCSDCDSEAVASLLQRPLCEEHAEERLDELEVKIADLEAKVEKLKTEYENLCENYDVQSYGEIEHQLNVEGREDIDEEDVQAVNEAESAYAGNREELRGIKQKAERLRNQL